MVRRSVHTGTRREKITTPGPIFAPRALRYSTYRGVPKNRRAAGLDRTRVFTIQKRTYVRLHRRICWAFQRPMSTHFATIGTAQTTTKAEQLASTNRRQISTALEPVETHCSPSAMPTTAR